MESVERVSTKIIYIVRPETGVLLEFNRLINISYGAVRVVSWYYSFFVAVTALDYFACSDVGNG